MIKLKGRSRIINFDEYLPVTREVLVTYKDGKPFKPLPPKCFSVKCNIQPLSGDDLLMVPEGDRIKDQFWLWTEYDMERNDIIERSGLNFQVQTVEEWGTYTKSRIVRIDVGDKAKE